MTSSVWSHDQTFHVLRIHLLCSSLVMIMIFFISVSPRKHHVHHRWACRYRRSFLFIFLILPDNNVRDVALTYALQAFSLLVPRSSRLLRSSTPKKLYLC